MEVKKEQEVILKKLEVRKTALLKIMEVLNGFRSGVAISVLRDARQEIEDNSRYPYE